METYIQLILILALAKYCLKAALTNRLWIIACYGVLAAVIALALYPIVIEQPLSIVRSLLENQTLVANGAVITTIEAVAGIFISILLLDNYFMPPEKRNKTIFFLKVFPGILFCISIAYFELLFFSRRVGADFMATAILYSIIVFVAIVGIAILFRYILKGESIKLELKVLLNIGILIIGLLINASVADYSLSFAQTTVEWKALLALVCLTLTFVVMGIYLPRLNIKLLLKRH